LPCETSAASATWVPQMGQETLSPGFKGSSILQPAILHLWSRHIFFPESVGMPPFSMGTSFMLQMGQSPGLSDV
jgi:hypothetical protein